MRRVVILAAGGAVLAVAAVGYVAYSQSRRRAATSRPGPAAKAARPPARASAPAPVPVPVSAPARRPAPAPEPVRVVRAETAAGSSPRRRGASMRRRLIVSVAGTAALAVGGTAAWTVARDGTPTPVAPVAAPAQATATAAAAAPKLVIPINFADPDVIKAGQTYYAYATNARGKNMPVASAPSLRGPWKQRRDGLPKLGAWAKTGRTWAPDVMRRKDGKFVLYYSAVNRSTGRHCLGAALASSPLGPFQPAAKPLVCDAPAGATHPGVQPEIIDAGSFSQGGRNYVLYKVGYNSHGKRSFLALQRVSTNGLSRVGKPKVILAQTNEPYTVEAPDLVYRQGKYVLFYSAGVFSKDNYQTRYAVASKLGGPYKKAAKPLMTTGGFGRKVNGPGGADALWGGAGVWNIVFHGAILPGPPPEPDPSPHPKKLTRGMYVAGLGWTKSGYPVVR
ncbi:glycoside hydrolase family 43 protein [Spirillospora sp. NPDC048911]|uniref:glycoside hydrolase family 43 protein n=1 Tax=Spirillospora sp. NPDC048911 TaxID=3364527 RepID=UPI00371FD43D